MSDLFKSEVAGCVYKKGLVHAAKPGYAQVRFDDLDGLVTDWLPTTHDNAQNNKDVETLDVGAQVSCILGAHYSNVDTPPVNAATKWHKRFSDGTSIEYDRAAHVLTILIGGTRFTLSAAGFDIAGGGVTTTGDQVAGSVSQMAHVHGGVTPGGSNSGSPKQ